MSKVDKKSVREEFSLLKREFEKVSSAGNLPPEARVLMNSLFLLFELVLSIFLEKKTKKTSKNSGKPSSQTDKDESSTDNNGTNEKGKKEKEESAFNSRTREIVRISKVVLCNVCGEELKEIECQKHERRTKIDIVFEKVVEHVDAEVKECPTCESKVKGKFPNDMSGPLQYGNGLKAYIISMLISQMVSLNRVQKSVKAMISSVISEATMLKYVLQLNYALEKWEKVSIEKLLKRAAINTDETSLRVDKKNHWIHVYSSGDIVLKFLHKKRGKEAIEDLCIIPRYGGVIIHDCWSSYFSYKHCLHGLCGSHLLRELTFVVESNGYSWAKNMKQLLKETCKKVSNRKQKRLFAREYKNLQKRYRNIITRGEKELPVIPENLASQRGRVAKSEAHNLWERLKKHEAAVLLFAKESHVSFTNNRAEQDLRMSKVKQKVSGCFRTEKLARAYCRISSYLQTMANRGHNPLIAIQMALQGDIYS